jgi:phosphatidylglycerol:prolipoprotein diacylglycerol transferase
VNRAIMSSLGEPIIHYPFVIPLGSVPISGFGIAVALGFIIGQIVAESALVGRGQDPAPMSDVVLASIAGFLIGAKLYYVALNPTLSAVFSREGFVFWGGLLGGIAASWVVIRRRGIPFLGIADAAAPGIAAGYAVGRTGCWAVGDDYGRPWDGPFAVAFPEGIPPSTAGSLAGDFGASIPADVLPDTVLAVHPTQLYETAMGLVMFWILWRLRTHRHAAGWLFGMYCVLAGVERFLVEFYRAKDDRFAGPFTSAQIIALGFLVAGAVLMATALRRTHPRTVGRGTP